ncbi:hypothetical protein ASPCAL13767 [Aspergillus calidoustus]|uniref:Uncharacterized protein n=1 Tax=Aspergillus calidoustus TaxID=454130 RepID=A0A0U5GFH0_ASPCI|nr:hypothetical protein ASPCAL13767 [Aspergillus calidoustus]
MLSFLVVATLWISHGFAELVVPDPTFKDLAPVPRHVWADSLANRADATASVALADYEKFMWASSEMPGEKPVVVSMIAYSKQNEKIIDMDRFTFALDPTTSCTAQDFSLRFKHPLIYEAAKVAWDWVNYDDLRSFVIVPSWEGCGGDRSHDHWVVTKVEFDNKESKIVLEASPSTWKKVIGTFVLDFGKGTFEQGYNRRNSFPDLDGSLMLDVSTSFPEEILIWEDKSGFPNARLRANCTDCSTEGILALAGHVEGSLSGTGVKIDKLELSIKPQGVKIRLGVSLELDGDVDFRDSSQPSGEVTLLDYPVSGWRVPGVFQFGPSFKINAGYVIDYIRGTADFTTGVTAEIPDTAIVDLDLKAANSGQFYGWTPGIEVNPLALHAQIDAQTRLYTEIVATVSLTVLEDNGFGVDLSLKIPQLTLTTSGGFDESGFCEPSGGQFGVKIDSTVGANLVLEGWGEVVGQRVPLANATLLDAPDLFIFPQVCEAFATPPEGYPLAE